MRPPLRITAVTTAGLLGSAAFVVPAQAASGSLTVNVVDRDGHVAKPFVYMLNPATQQTFTVTAGTTHKLRNGRYGMLTFIETPGGLGPSTQTLGSRTVLVNGKHVTVTIDARRGTPFQVSTNRTPGTSSNVEGYVWVEGQYLYGGPADYLIPDADKRIRFCYQADWTTNSSGPYYFAASRNWQGIPANVMADYSHAKFAKLQMKVQKARGTNHTATLMMGSADCAGQMNGWGSFRTPGAITAYVTGGAWTGWLWYADANSGVPQWTGRYAAGKTYHLTIRPLGS